MKLEDLVGPHYLSGVDFEKLSFQETDYTDDATSVNFVLDGVTYTAVEDPQDGYRSCLRDLFVSNEKVKNMFEPFQVVGIMDNQHDNEVLDFNSVENGKLVLSVGTSNADDYYPSFIAHFVPENIPIVHKPKRRGRMLRPVN